jgi:hypothetical protein
MARSLFVLAAVTVAVIGVAITAYALTRSLLPTETMKEAARVRVELAKVPDEGFLEVDWSYYRVLLVRTSGIRAFGIPYQNSAYMLPDPSWELARTPCGRIELINSEFRCTDANLHALAREQYKWKKTGEAVSSAWLPALVTLPYRIEGNYLVLGPE